jgi:hypothetical protein
VSLRAAGGGVGISAGASSAGGGVLTFSNSNGVSFGIANGVLTATVTPGAAAGIAAVGAGANTGTSGTMIFSNSNGVSFGLAANSSVITASVAGGGGAAISAAGSSQNAGTVVFSNSNNVSFGMNGSTVTASASAQSNQTVGLYGLGNTTQNSSTTLDARSLSFNGLGELTVGFSNGSIQLSAPPSSIGVSNIGNTAGNTGTYSGQVVFAGGNNVTLSVGTAAGGAQTVTISAAAGAGAAISAAGSSQNAGTIVFSNSNNISFGMNGSTVTASASAQSNQSMGVYFSSQTTGQSSSTTVDARSITYVGYGVVSVGASGGSILISAPGTTSYGAFSDGLSNIGNTSGNTGLVTGQMVWAGGNNVTLSGSTNAGSMTITISANAEMPIGVSTGGNTAGNTSMVTGQLVLVGGANITLSEATGANGFATVSIAGGAGGAGAAISAAGSSQNAGTIVFSNSNNVSFGMNGSTITASASAQSNQSLGFYFVNNTTGASSSSTVDARSVSYTFGGALSGGMTGGTIELSAPATSSISGTGLVSVAVNGSTISIGASPVQLSFFQPLPSLNTTVTQNGAGSIQVYPALHPIAFTATRADIMASISAAALAISTQAQTVSMYVGLYSLNGSTLSLASSGSQSYAFTNSSNNSNASITGIRRFSAPINVNYTGGFDLFVGVMTNTTFANTNGISLSNVVVPVGPGPQLQGLIGQVPANSMQFVPGQGFFSASSAALPSSMGLSAISGAGSGGNAVDYYAPVQFVNMTA